MDIHSFEQILTAHLTLNRAERCTIKTSPPMFHTIMRQSRFQAQSRKATEKLGRLKIVVPFTFNLSCRF